MGFVVFLDILRMNMWFITILTIIRILTWCVHSSVITKKTIISWVPNIFYNGFDEKKIISWILWENTKNIPSSKSWCHWTSYRLYLTCTVLSVSLRGKLSFHEFQIFFITDSTRKKSSPEFYGKIRKIYHLQNHGVIEHHI